MAKIERAFVLRVVCLLLCLLNAPLFALAGSIPNPAGFSARMILPENQLENAHGYFSLLVEPARRQQIEVEVANQLDIPITLQVDVNNASTSPNGLISYSSHEGEAEDDGALRSFVGLLEELLYVGPGRPILEIRDNLIVLAPYATVRLPFLVAMPPERIDGQILGGIVLTRVERDSSPEGESSFAIQSVYSYAIAVQLQMEVEPSLEPVFTLHSAELATLAGMDAVRIELENVQPLVLSGGSLRVRVFSQDAQFTLLDVTNAWVSIAPSSILPYTVMIPASLTLANGAYPVQVDLEHNGSTWTMQTMLNISRAGN